MSLHFWPQALRQASAILPLAIAQFPESGTIALHKVLRSLAQCLQTATPAQIFPLICH
jgi:hypothetical protein